jgi:elongation factor 3
MGIDEQIAMYSEIKGLSGGQKVKLVISSALFNKPHVLVVSSLYPY